jgi:hypothetical protein
MRQLGQRGRLLFLGLPVVVFIAFLPYCRAYCTLLIGLLLPGWLVLVHGQPEKCAGCIQVMAIFEQIDIAISAGPFD